MLFGPTPSPLLDDQASPEARKAWQQITNGYRVRVGLRSLVFPTLANAFVFPLYAHWLAPIACHFRDDAWLSSLWPANRIYVDQLATSKYPEVDVCWLFAVTSTASGVWMLWRVGFETFRRDVVFVPGSTKIFLLRFVTGEALLALTLLPWWILCVAGFKLTPQIYNLSLSASMGVNAFKIVFLMLPFIFFTLGVMAEYLLLFVRYAVLSIRHRSN